MNSLVIKTLNGGEWLTTRPGCITLKKEPRRPWNIYWSNTDIKKLN